jgi:hypothetical protein
MGRIGQRDGDNSAALTPSLPTVAPSRCNISSVSSKRARISPTAIAAKLSSLSVDVSERLDGSIVEINERRSIEMTPMNLSLSADSSIATKASNATAFPHQMPSQRMKTKRVSGAIYSVYMA